MFTINIFLRFALIAGSVIAGIILTIFFGFWYAFPLYLIALILFVGYLMIGTVQSASLLMQKQDIAGAKKRLALTFFPKLLFGPGRSAYYMLKGSFAMQEKDYNAANESFKESENSKYTSDNEKAMIYLQQANLAALKNNYRQAATLVKKAEELKVTESMIKDQIKQFKQALGKTGQMGMQNRMAMSQRGGTKQRRPKMR
ncbi:MAG: hypothetical protein J5I59_00065 [Saprospiraceae bacterium]|nr:hypothetical protein [Saprospiraceae bacterium]